MLALLEPRDEAGRRDFYDRVWDGWRWRLLFRVFFSRFVMARLGRDPEFFRHVEGSVGARILARARYALTALPVHANPYVEMILTGRFRRALPPYLEPGVWEGVRAHLDRLTLHQGGIDEVAMAEVAHAAAASTASTSRTCSNTSRSSRARRSTSDSSPRRGPAPASSTGTCSSRAALPSPSRNGCGRSTKRRRRSSRVTSPSSTSRCVIEEVVA